MHPSRPCGTGRDENGLNVWQHHLYGQETKGVDSLENIEKRTYQWQYWSGSCGILNSSELCAPKLLVKYSEVLLPGTDH